MGKRVGMEVSIAAAEAVKQANVDVISAYPITPADAYCGASLGACGQW